jgi:hypothetical protein
MFHLGALQKGCETKKTPGVWKLEVRMRCWFCWRRCCLWGKAEYQRITLPLLLICEKWANEEKPFTSFQFNCGDKLSTNLALP